jgi:hypothetical protein
MTLLWIVAMAAIIVGLMYWEQIALLYVLATLGMTALLVVVAVADLGGTKKALAEPPVSADDAAAIGTGIGSTMSPPAGSSAARRR